MSEITKTECTGDKRLDFLPKCIPNPLAMIEFENFVYTIAGRFTDYNGGLWRFWDLDNNGFFMSPDTDVDFHFQNPDNYSDVNLSAEALGIVACLYAFSHLSFKHHKLGDFYHLLAEYAYDHPEAAAIWESVD